MPKSETSPEAPAPEATIDDFLQELDVAPKRQSFFGKTIYIATLKASERGECILSEEVLDGSGEPIDQVTIRRANYLKYGVVNKAGDPIFTFETALQYLGKRSNKPEALVGRVITHNNATEEDEELEGNEN